MRAATTSVDTHGPLHAPCREIKKSWVYRGGGEVNTDYTLQFQLVLGKLRLGPDITKYTTTNQEPFLKYDVILNRAVLHLYI